MNLGVFNRVNLKVLISDEFSGLYSFLVLGIHASIYVYFTVMRVLIQF